MRTVTALDYGLTVLAAIENDAGIEELTAQYLALDQLGGKAQWEP
jgi:hypothetical protein